MKQINHAKPGSEPPHLLMTSENQKTQLVTSVLLLLCPVLCTESVLKSCVSEIKQTRVQAALEKAMMIVTFLFQMESQEPDIYVPDGPTTLLTSPKPMSTAQKATSSKLNACPKPHKSLATNPAPQQLISKAPMVMPEELIEEDSTMDIDQEFEILPFSLFEGIWKSAFYKHAY
ncbi:hypothetical protein FRC10_012095 [Ceratobasidium sp. 414]|nr:hypothetical protein FRC10_012095 [Ceratobasidium sp. 414]